jgi:hypothetical protein
MKQIIKFCDKADFYFIIEYMAHHNTNLNEIDDIDLFYQQVAESFQRFEISPQFLQSTSYLQAIKDFLNSDKTP